MLAVREVRSGYGNKEVLHGVSLDVPQGSIVTLLGANGAGKTTLLNTIIGVLAPTAGSIAYQGRPLANKTPDRAAKAGVLLVPERRELFLRPAVQRYRLTFLASCRSRELILRCFVLAASELISMLTLPFSVRRLTIPPSAMKSLVSPTEKTLRSPRLPRIARRHLGEQYLRSRAAGRGPVATNQSENRHESLAFARSFIRYAEHNAQPDEQYAKAACNIRQESFRASALAHYHSRNFRRQRKLDS